MSRPRRREFVYMAACVALLIFHQVRDRAEVKPPLVVPDVVAMGAPCIWLAQYGGPTPPTLRCVNAVQKGF